MLGHTCKNIITVDLRDHPRNTPLGIILAPAAHVGSGVYNDTEETGAGVGNVGVDASLPERSTTILVAGWSRGQKLGPIQKMSNVRIGDQLVQINQTNIKGTLNFRQTMDLIKIMIYDTDDAAFISSSGRFERGKIGAFSTRLKSLGFEPNPYRLSHQSAQGQINTTTGMASSRLSWSIMKNGQLYAFQSSIQRVRRKQEEHKQDEENHCDADVGEFVEYEIACRLVVKQIATGKRLKRIMEDGEMERTWSVWKRYSDFKSLDNKLRQNYGWHMKSINGGWGVDFPGTHMFSMVLFGNMSLHFVKQRRKEFQSYWKSLQECEELFDFTDPTSHRFSRDIATFLDIDRQFPRSPRHQATCQSRVVDESHMCESTDMDQSSISQLSQSCTSFSGTNCEQDVKMTTNEKIITKNDQPPSSLNTSFASNSDLSNSDNIREIRIPAKQTSPNFTRRPRRKPAKAAFQRIGLDF